MAEAPALASVAEGLRREMGSAAAVRAGEALPLLRKAEVEAEDGLAAPPGLMPRRLPSAPPPRALGDCVPATAAALTASVRPCTGLPPGASKAPTRRPETVRMLLKLPLALAEPKVRSVTTPPRCRAPAVMLVSTTITVGLTTENVAEESGASAPVAMAPPAPPLPAGATTTSGATARASATVRVPTGAGDAGSLLSSLSSEGDALPALAPALEPRARRRRLLPFVLLEVRPPARRRLERWRGTPPPAAASGLASVGASLAAARDARRDEALGDEAALLLSLRRRREATPPPPPPPESLRSRQRRELRWGWDRAEVRSVFGP